jgi:hypothetical protein
MMGTVTPTMVSQAAANRLSKLQTRTPSAGVPVQHHAPSRQSTLYTAARGDRSAVERIVDAEVGGQTAANFREAGHDICSSVPVVAFAVFNSRKARSASSSRRHPSGAPRVAVRVSKEAAVLCSALRVYVCCKAQ